MELAHTMSPAGVAGLLFLALIVDYMSLGPNSIRDRLAFFLGLAAVREGFNGSPLDKWTVGALGSLIDQLKSAAGDAYIAGVSTEFVVGLLVGGLAILTAGALMPEKFATKLGRWATIKLPTSAMYRMNWKLWIGAILLGMLADLPRGAIGTTLTWFVDTDVAVTAPIPAFLFGS